MSQFLQDLWDSLYEMEPEHFIPLLGASVITNVVLTILLMSTP